VDGEFGRTPQINGSAGRDHFPAAWTAVLAGGGIRGGQAYGRTSADGMTVDDGKINEGDLIATLCAAMGSITAATTSPKSAAPSGSPKGARSNACSHRLLTPVLATDCTRMKHGRIAKSCCERIGSAWNLPF